MNNVLTIWAKTEEAFWNILDASEKVREKLEGKLESIKKLLCKAAIIEVSMLVVLLISIAINKPGVAILATVGSVLLIWVVYLTSAAVKDLLIFAAKMLPESKDKTKQAERKAGLEKMELNLLKFTSTINHIGMAITVITTWTFIFGIGSNPLHTAGMLILIVLFATALGFFSKKETAWPRKVMIVAMAISTIYWFTTLDTVPSRVLASYISKAKIAQEEGTDKRTSAIVDVDAIAYDIDTVNGNLVESDTLLTATVLRLTNAIAETRRIDGESFTKVIIPNEFGSYARGKRSWVQSSCLDIGLKFYPNANKPDYAVKKTKKSGGESWEIYFLTDNAIILENMPLGKRITVVTSGLMAWDSEYERFVPMTPGRRTPGRTIVSSTKIVFKKGGKAIIFFS